MVSIVERTRIDCRHKCVGGGNRTRNWVVFDSIEYNTT